MGSWFGKIHDRVSHLWWYVETIVIPYHSQRLRYYIKLLTIRVFPSYYFLGTAIGTVISLVTSGLIADNPKLGWEGVFYIHGGLSLIWCILWTIFVRDCPENHHLISADELEYIQNDQCSKHRTTVTTLLWDPYVKNKLYFNWNHLNHLNHTTMHISYLREKRTTEKFLGGKLQALSHSGHYS